jgi:hypothetical protein
VSPGLWILTAILGVVLAGTVRTAWRAWRGQSGELDRVLGTWPFSPASWRGVVRALPVFALWGTAFFAGGVLARIGEHSVDGVVGAVGAAVFVFGAVCSAGVILFNRPRFVVPPSRRHEPGLLAERRAGTALDDTLPGTDPTTAAPDVLMVDEEDLKGVPWAGVIAETSPLRVYRNERSARVVAAIGWLGVLMLCGGAFVGLRQPLAALAVSVGVALAYVPVHRTVMRRGVATYDWGIVIRNPAGVTRLPWNKIERFLVVEADAPREDKALVELRDSRLVRLTALHNTLFQPKGDAEWLRGAIAELNEQLATTARPSASAPPR